MLSVAHKIYGIPQAINSGNYAYFLAYQELFKLRDQNDVRPPAGQELDRIVTGSSALCLLPVGAEYGSLQRSSSTCTEDKALISSGGIL